MSNYIATRPQFSPAEAQTLAQKLYNIQATAKELPSERDQNFCLLTADGSRYLVKVTSAAEAVTTTTFQLGALRHLEPCPDVIAPTIVSTLDGDEWGHIDNRGSSHRLRLLSWVDGDQFAALGIDVALAGAFGRALGRLDDALAGYAYQGDNPVLLWDLQRIAGLRPLLRCIDDADIRVSVEAAIDDFEEIVVPLKAELPHQVIHADANPENVLACSGGVGFIDFGDIVRAPRCFEPGIAASYLRIDGGDPLELVRPFISGYHAVAALEPSEVEVMFDIVRARLATSIALLYWRLQDRPADDEYRCKSLESERNASHFLAALDTAGRSFFTREIRELTRKAAAT